MSENQTNLPASPETDAETPDTTPETIEIRITKKTVAIVAAATAALTAAGAFFMFRNDDDEDDEDYDVYSGDELVVENDDD